MGEMNGMGTRVIVFMQWHTWGDGEGLEFSSLDMMLKTFSFEICWTNQR